MKRGLATRYGACVSNLTSIIPTHYVTLEVIYHFNDIAEQVSELLYGIEVIMYTKQTTLYQIVTAFHGPIRN